LELTKIQVKKQKMRSVERIICSSAAVCRLCTIVETSNASKCAKFRQNQIIVTVRAWTDRQIDRDTHIQVIL